MTFPVPLRTAILAATLLAACAGTRLTDESSDFHKVETDHFTLYSDVSAEDAREHAINLERLLAAYSQLGWRGSDALPFRLNVVMLDRKRDFERHAPPFVGGYYASPLLMQSWIIIPAQPVHQARVLKHELTHALAFETIRRQPRWFAEGVASYFETARMDDEGHFVIGVLSDDFLIALWRHGIIPAAELFDPAEREFRTSRFYASAWLLVHYLLSERADDFERYQRSVAQGTEYHAAFESAFPDLTTAELDTRLRRYFIAKQFAEYLRPVVLPASVPVRQTKLTVADEHALQGVLWMSGCGGCKAEEHSTRARQAFGAALALDPFQPQAASAALVHADDKDDATLARARTLTEKHPDDWLAWATFGIVADRVGKLDDGLVPDPISHLERLAPRHEYTFLLKAQRYAHSGVREPALASARRARRFASRNGAVLNQLANLYRDLGACSELAEVVGAVSEQEHWSVSEKRLNELKGMIASCAR